MPTYDPKATRPAGASSVDAVEALLDGAPPPVEAEQPAHESTVGASDDVSGFADAPQRLADVNVVTGDVVNERSAVRDLAVVALVLALIAVLLRRNHRAARRVGS